MGLDRSPSPDLPGVPLAPPPPGGGLGNTAKSVSHFPSATDAQERRATRFKHQRGRRNCCPPRTGLCMWAVASSPMASMSSTTRRRGAPASGLQTCGSVWACPCCSGTVSEQRRRELNALLAWARKQGLHPVMLTLTARHSVDHRLAELLDGMKNAKRRLTTHRTFAKLLRPQLVGYVTATEVTGGASTGGIPTFTRSCW